MNQPFPSRLQTVLSPGEKLLWQGQPLTGVRLRKQDAFLIPFSLLWGGFAIFWELGVLKTNAPFFFRLWGIPFVLIGLYLIFGRFFVDAKQREKTIYAVTNERIIIVSGIFGTNVRSLNLKTLAETNLDEKADGTGTILFGPTFSVMRNPGGGWPGSAKNAVPAFEMIASAKQVHDLIRRSQSEAK